MRRARPLIALAAALVVGGWLLFSPTSRDVPPTVAPSGAGTVTATLTPGVVPARLADGAIYTPLLYLDTGTSVGTASSPDGTAERLLLRGAGAPRELRSVPKDRFPQWLGLTAADGVLYWAESSATAAGPYETRLWRAPVAPAAGPPVALTADTGGIVFFESQYDLVVAEDRLHWVAAPPDDTPKTEVRSIALTGGAVAKDVIDGRYRWSAWPWLLSVDPGAATLLNRADGQRRPVPATAAETLLCSPEWCRAIAETASGRNLVDVMHADGSDRRRLPGDVNAIGVDVGLLDRFELLTGVEGESLRLLAYDLPTGRTIVLAGDVGVVTTRGGLVWWSTGNPEPTDWHVLDLHQLA
ncbi:hypothetical protein ACFPIJ_47750 [Dactylosporangium cerinum]|uniref:Uncharacterized protein n=1 Tax=Dactylosporangium cerinum TaxID=1434730 RepID=A0ABV9WDJ4_9ACTN